MEPYDRWKANGGARVDDAACPVASPDTDLNGLGNLAVDTDNPILIREDGSTVGVVTKTALLRGIQGEP